MYNLTSINTLADYASISQFLYAQDNARKAAMEWNESRGDSRHPFMLRFCQKVLNHAKTFDIGTERFEKVAGYTYTLCGKYLLKAMQIKGHGGGGIVATRLSETTVAIGFIPRDLQFVIGQAGALMADGATTYTITDNDIEVGSIEVFVDGIGRLPYGLSDRPSYQVLYTTTGAVITLLQQAAATGQVWNTTWRKKMATVSTSSTSVIPSPPIYYTATGAEGTTLTRTELYGKSLEIVYRDGRPQYKVAANPGIGQITFDNNTLLGAVPAGSVGFGEPLNAGEQIIITTL